MAIQDDIVIDVVDKKITYTTAFVDDRPPNIYTANELYSYLQDTFDEPGFMQYSIPMSVQTPTQYTLINGWFVDDNTMKAFYGGSIQTSGWTKSGAAGITQLRWEDASSDPPVAGDIGVILTGGVSSATGVLLAVDATRQVAWVRNTHLTNQFQSAENVTGTGVDLDTEDYNGFQNGETIWANLYSVGSKSVTTEIYIGQEDDYQGGRAYHGVDVEAQERRKIEKVDEWWDVDVDFATGSPNLLGGVDHFDVLVKVQEAGALIDSGSLFVGARQFGTVYSHFELTAASAGNFVVPFASTGADINSAEGPYEADFSANSGTIAIGDIIENDTGTTPVGRLRAIITDGTTLDQATGNIEYYLIGENEPLTSTDRTLKQWTNGDNARTRGGSPTFDINSVPAEVTAGPAQDQSTSITFGNAQYDINEDTTDEEYACVIDCNSISLQDVYQYHQFLSCRGNQDGTTADTQDTLLSSAVVGVDETSEFYRAVGDITVPWNAKTGTPPAEGVFVTNANASWTASGVVVALSNPAGASGQLTLTQVKGTWANSNTAAEVGDHGSNEVTINGTPSSITDNTGAPLGTFAGGRWFVARGIVLINVPAGDANNWETTDLGGDRIAPPTQRGIIFGGLEAYDRAALFEVSTAGGDDIKKDHSTYSSGGAVSDTSFVTGEAIALDVPTDGWVRHVDDSSTTGEEFRYEYSSYVSGGTSTVTLRPVAGGTDDGGGTSTVISLTGVASTYGTNGEPKTGMMARATTGEYAIVLRKITNDTIETTPLSGAASWSGKTFEFNEVVVAMAASDTYYWPFVDDESISGADLTATIKYVHSTNLIARARLSDPDVSGTRYLPFVQKSITLGDADLTITAIRTEDLIAS